MSQKAEQSKNKNGWVGRVAQVVEHLPSKREAISLKPQYSPPKKRKQEK
jgi:hypothetical protein